MKVFDELRTQIKLQQKYIPFIFNGVGNTVCLESKADLFGALVLMHYRIKVIFNFKEMKTHKEGKYTYRMPFDVYGLSPEGESHCLEIATGIVVFNDHLSERSPLYEVREVNPVLRSSGDSYYPEPLSSITREHDSVEETITSLEAHIYGHFKDLWLKFKENNVGGTFINQTCDMSQYMGLKEYDINFGFDPEVKFLSYTISIEERSLTFSGLQIAEFTIKKGLETPITARIFFYESSKQIPCLVHFENENYEMVCKTQTSKEIRRPAFWIEKLMGTTTIWGKEWEQKTDEICMASLYEFFNKQKVILI